MFFFYRHCLLISGENVKRFWILVRVLVSNKCWRHAEHIVVSSACRQKFVLGWSFSPRWLFVQRVASRVALSEDINKISVQHAPDKLWVSKILVQNLYEFYEFCSTFLRHCYIDKGNLFLFNFLFCFMTWIIAKVTESLTGRKINIYESQQMNTYCSKSITLYQPNLDSLYRKFEHKLKLISRHQNTMQNCRLFVGLWFTSTCDDSS